MTTFGKIEAPIRELSKQTGKKNKKLYINMRKKILLFFAASILFTSCGIYDKYEPKGTVSADAFGSTQDVNAAKGDVGAVPYAGLRKRLEGQNHFFA